MGRSNISQLLGKTLLSVSSILSTASAQENETLSMPPVATVSAAGLDDIQSKESNAPSAPLVEPAKSLFSFPISDRSNSTVHIVRWEDFDPVIPSSHNFDPQERHLCSLTAIAPELNLKASISLDDPSTPEQHEEILAIADYIRNTYIPNNPDLLQTLGAESLTQLTSRQAVMLVERITSDHLEYSLDQMQLNNLSFNDDLPISALLKNPPGTRGNAVCRNYVVIAQGVLEAIKTLQDGNSLSSTYLIYTNSYGKLSTATAIPGQIERHAWATIVVFGENEACATAIDPTWSDSRQKLGDAAYARLLSIAHHFQIADLISPRDLASHLLQMHQSLPREAVIVPNEIKSWQIEHILPLRTRIAQRLLQMSIMSPEELSEFNTELLALAKDHVHDLNERYLAVLNDSAMIASAGFDLVIRQQFLANYVNVTQFWGAHGGSESTDTLCSPILDNYVPGAQGYKDFDGLALLLEAHTTPPTELETMLRKYYSKTQQPDELYGLLNLGLSYQITTPDSRLDVCLKALKKLSKESGGPSLETPEDNQLNGESELERTDLAARFFARLGDIQARSPALISVDGKFIPTILPDELPALMDNLEAFFCEPSRRNLLRYRKVILSRNETHLDDYASITLPGSLFTSRDLNLQAIEETFKRNERYHTSIGENIQKGLILKYKDSIPLSFTSGSYPATRLNSIYPLLESHLQELGDRAKFRIPLSIAFQSEPENNSSNDNRTPGSVLLDLVAPNNSLIYPAGLKLQAFAVEDPLDIEGLPRNGFTDFVRVIRRGEHYTFTSNGNDSVVLRSKKGAVINKLKKGDLIYLAEELPAFYCASKETIYLDPGFSDEELAPAIERAFRTRQQLSDLNDKFITSHIGIKCTVDLPFYLGGPVAHSPAFMNHAHEVSDQFIRSWLAIKPDNRINSEVKLVVGMDTLTLSATNLRRNIIVDIPDVADVAKGAAALKTGIGLTDSLELVCRDREIIGTKLLGRVTLSEDDFPMWKAAVDTIREITEAHGRIPLEFITRDKQRDFDSSSFGLIKVRYDGEKGKVVCELSGGER